MPNMVQTIKKIAMEAVEASKPAAVCFGTIVSTAPLNITVEQKLTLDETFLICTEHTDSLAAGDHVILLRMQGGQRYVVLCKEAPQ